MISSDKFQELKSRISKLIIKNGEVDSKYLKSLDGIRRYYAALLPVTYSDQFDAVLISALSDYIISMPSMTLTERRKIIGQFLPFNSNKTMKDLLDSVSEKLPDSPFGNNVMKSNKKLIASILSPSFMQSSLWNAQKSMSVNNSNIIAEKIIVGKIKNQMNLCKYFNKYHKTVGVDAPFDVLLKSLSSVLEKIKKVDTLDSKVLMGYEAAAAEAYWEYIRHLISDDNVGFYSRVKKGATDLVNSMLNYGYSLLYPRIWQAILRKKLNPYIGFVHYAEGNPNLVFDVIELFRSQTVDRVVISMIQKKEHAAMANGLLDEATRNQLTRHVLERLNRYEKYRGEDRRLSEIIELQVGELVSAIVSGTTYRPYIAKW